LRIIILSGKTNPAMTTEAITLATVYCSTLAQYHRDELWDMAEETLKRLAEPAFTTGRNIVQAREIYTIIAIAMGYPSDGESASVSSSYQFGNKRAETRFGLLIRSIPTYGPIWGCRGLTNQVCSVRIRPTKWADNIRRVARGQPGMCGAQLARSFRRQVVA